MSVIARGAVVVVNRTLLMPRTERNLSAGTICGPGEGALPGTGCGKAVE
jgi:hypothetical protein